MIKKLKFFALVFTCLLVFLFQTTLAAAATSDATPYAPYELTAATITPDETHPNGSALLTFKINNLPRSDDANLSVFIEKKIGNDGVWKGVSEEATNNYHDYYKMGEGEYAYEQLWNESYAWEPQTPVFFRVKVTLYDETFALISESAWSNIASIGVTLSEENPAAPSEVVSPDPAETPAPAESPVPAETPAPAESPAPVANTGNILDDVPKTGDSTVGLLLPVALMGVAFLGCAILLWRKGRTLSE